MRRQAALLILPFVGLALAGCSMTLPVNGQILNSNERFTGSATGLMDGSGTLEITSNKGTTCKGTFVYVTQRNGEGTATCSDGRAGAFRFVSTGTRGTGSGDFGSGKLIFTFGD